MKFSGLEKTLCPRRLMEGEGVVLISVEKKFRVASSGTENKIIPVLRGSEHQELEHRR